MKKNLLIALALPAMFAACSQEDVISNGQMQAGLLGTPAGEIDFVLGEGVDSRVDWGTSGNPSWSTTDAFSLFWVGATGENKSKTNVYKSATNALYQSEGDGQPFTSKNIVYVGKHIIVSLADYAHVTDQEITVKVGKEQKASDALGNRTVLISELLDIQARPEKESDRKENVMYAGYAEPVSASVTPLSSNMVLNLNFAFTESMTEVKIKSIELEASNDIFAYEGNLKVNDKGFMSLVPTKKGNTMTLVMPENTKVTKNSPKYVAQIALLPPVSSALSNSNYKILVNTNFGIVTIDKAMLVTNNNGKYQIEAGVNYDEKAAKTITETTALSFKTEFSDIADRIKGATEDENEKSFGKRFARNVVVNMSTASIEGMKIANSQDLIDAYEVYDILGKGQNDNISFIMVGEKDEEETEATFELTPAAAKAIAEHPYVKLALARNADEEVTCTTLALVNEENSAFTAVPDLAKALGEERGNLDVVLGAGTWALNVKDAALVNNYNTVHNQGNLTITDAAVTPAGAALKVAICNDATVTFNGTVNMPVAYNQTKEAKTNVGTSAYVYLNAGGNISGEADIDGKFAVHGGLVEINADAKIAVAGSLLTASTGTMNNLGTITLEGTGSTIVSSNQDGEAMGSIVLAKRNSSAKVNDAKEQGYIKWICNVNQFRENTGDAFNCLVLNNNLSIRQLGSVANNGSIIYSSVKYIEVAGSKVTIEPEYDDVMFYLERVLVNENSTLVVPIDMKMNTSSTEVNGDIEVYGSYTAGTVTGDGHIYYYNDQVNVGTKDALLEAINMKEAKTVVLESNIMLDKNLEINNKDITINLNGYTLTAGDAYDTNQDMAAAILVNGGNVVIEGEGTVNGGEGNHYNMAIRANDGTVTIKGGNFVVGDDDEGNPNTVVYATRTAKVIIEKGYFAYEGTKMNTEYLLNIKDADVSTASITVKGGTFKNFNPAQNNAESVSKSFVADGYKVKAFDKDGNKLTDNTTQNYNESRRGKAGENVTYEVYKSAK